LEKENIQEESVGLLIANLLDFVVQVRSGRVPSMRMDDWVPSVSDRQRAEKAQAQRAQDNNYLGTYP